MAPQADSDILSSLDLILPKNVIEACYTLKVGLGAVFLAKNTQKRTVSRMQLLKQMDESVKISLTVEALKSNASGMPEHIYIDRVSSRQEEDESPAETYSQLDVTTPKEETCRLPVQVSPSIGSCPSLPQLSPDTTKLLSPSLSIRSGETSRPVVVDLPELNARQGDHMDETITVTFTQENDQSDNIPEVGTTSCKEEKDADRQSKEPNEEHCQSWEVASETDEEAAKTEEHKFINRTDTKYKESDNGNENSKAEETGIKTERENTKVGKRAKNVQQPGEKDLEPDKEHGEKDTHVDRVTEVASQKNKSNESTSLRDKTSVENKYKQRANMKRPHYKREQKIACPLCLSKLKDYDTVFEHMKLRHTKAESDYEGALKRIKKCMKMPCQICHKVYSRREQLAIHMENMHQEQKEVKCDECDTVVKSIKHLKGHMRRIHDAPQVRFLCHLCPASFKLQAYLAAHLKNVHNDNPQDAFPCDMCGKACSSEKYLKNHKMRVHGAKKFVCEHCSMGFTNSGNMKRHVALVHDKTREKPFSCEQCSKKFALKSNLKEHVKGVHLKEYNIHCKHCGLGFRRKRELEQHESSVHGDGQKGSSTSTSNINYKAMSFINEENGIQYIVATPEMLEAFNVQLNVDTDQ